MAFSSERNAFVKWFIGLYGPKLHYFLSSLSASGGCKGASFVPVHRYGHGRAHLMGKFCIVAGKERAGSGNDQYNYKDQYNYFGGKVERRGSSLDEQMSVVAETLFDETLEELGLVLRPFPEGSYHDIFLCGPSIVFVTIITGISGTWWNKVVQDRKARNPSLAWKYQEMSSIEHIPVDEIASRKDLSKYIRDTANYLTHWIVSNWDLIGTRGIGLSYFGDTYGVTL